MGHRFQFDQAIEILEKLSQANTAEDVYELRESMEQIILDHYPRNAQEAAAILSTLLLNVESGSRIDGRDIKALSNLRHWCLSQADPATADSVLHVVPSAHR